MFRQNIPRNIQATGEVAMYFIASAIINIYSNIHIYYLHFELDI